MSRHGQRSWSLSPTLVGHHKWKLPRQNSDKVATQEIAYLSQIRLLVLSFRQMCRNDIEGIPLGWSLFCYYCRLTTMLMVLRFGLHLPMWWLLLVVFVKHKYSICSTVKGLDNCKGWVLLWQRIRGRSLTPYRICLLYVWNWHRTFKLFELPLFVHIWFWKLHYDV